MDVYATLRGAKQQLKDEFADDFDRMKDPEAREEAALRKHAKERPTKVSKDSGLEI